MKKNNIYLSLFFIYLIIFPFIDVVGIYNNYSPIPYWDMWNGNYLFYLHAKVGDLSSWFSQHNEHRIIFSRVLFYIDNYFFKGSAIFLLIINFLMIIFIYCIYDKILNKFDLNYSYSIFIKIATISLIFSWIQNENLVWGFQSQFIAAYLFPLISFYLILEFFYNKDIKYLYGSIIVAVMCIGTMGNGILVFPFLVLLFFHLRLNKKFILLLLGIFLLFFLPHLYFYKTPDFHDSALISLISNPFRSSLFILGFIGSPFFYISKITIISIFFGLLYILLLIISIALYIRFNHYLKKYLLIFYSIIFYSLISIIAISGSRGSSGFESSFASRYTTTSLIAWASLLVLLSILFYKSKFNKIIITLSLILSISLMPLQFNALKVKYQDNYEKEVAVLALSLSIKDKLFLDKIFPFTDWLLQMSYPIISSKLSVFSSPLFNNISRNLGTRVDINNPILVNGYIDRTEIITDVDKYQRVLGWMQTSSINYPQKLLFLNEFNEVIGIGLLGSSRPDLEIIFGVNSTRWGFYGYLQNVKYKKLFIYNDDTNELREIK